MNSETLPLGDRRESRYSIDSAVMPYLGSRLPDYSVFQYIIEDISLHGLKIQLPNWVLKRENLSIGDVIDFHLPFLFSGQVYDTGTVVWSRPDPKNNSISCGASIKERATLYYPVSISFESRGITIDLSHFDTSSNLLTKIFKDTVFLKRGVSIYLRHLGPVLHRFTDLDHQDAYALRLFLFDDAARRVKGNIAELTKMTEELRETGNPMENLYLLDLERLRQAIEPEISAELWVAAFSQGTMPQYVNAIKQLEKRLFYNYNTIIMLYTSLLSDLASEDKASKE